MPNAMRRLRETDYARYLAACRKGGRNAAKAKVGKKAAKQIDASGYDEWGSTPGRRARFAAQQVAK